MRIGLIPLDERPANTRYPAMLAAIAGAELALPPAEALSARRRPADCAALARWLAAEAPQLDALIVALEQLGHGGLIAARTSAEPAATILARLEPLRALRLAHPRLTIYGFSVITRVSNANDAVEEPAYWAEYGERLYALSQLLDRRRQGQPVAAELAALEAAIPAAHRRDFVARRLRNHAVNLAALGLLEDATLDLLVLSSDDTSPLGLPSAEKAWIAGWGELLGLAADGGRWPVDGDAGLAADGGRWTVDGEAGALSGTQHSALSTQHSALLMYPGADEVACVLLARLLNARAGVAPRVAVRYAPPEAAANVAAYEDGPIHLTVERQLLAAGGRLAEAEAALSTQHSALSTPPDLWLGVNAPLPRRAEWDSAHAEAERAERQDALSALVAEAAAQLAVGMPVAIADVAYPNGADPALSDALLGGIDLAALAAYGAWNTAGNTLGCVIAHAFVARLITTAEGRAAHMRFLLHRLVEDWGYQQLERAELRSWLRTTTGHPDPQTPEAVAASETRIEAALGTFIARLPAFAKTFRITPGSVRLPWGRTFEVDFAVQSFPEGGDRAA
jgi:hypothetical protein